jgi:hypothetical protein
LAFKTTLLPAQNAAEGEGVILAIGAVLKLRVMVEDETVQVPPVDTSDAITKNSDPLVALVTTRV